MAMITFGVALIVEYGRSRRDPEQHLQPQSRRSSTRSCARPAALHHDPARARDHRARRVRGRSTCFSASPVGRRAAGDGDRPRSGSCLGHPDEPRCHRAWVVSGFLCGLAGGVFMVNILTDQCVHGRRSALAGDRLGAAWAPRARCEARSFSALVIGIATQVASVAGASSYDSAVAYGLPRARAAGPSEDAARRTRHRPRADHRLVDALPVPMREE